VYSFTLNKILKLIKRGKEMKGFTRLRNIGNTCFVNAILQCLIHLPELNDWFDTQDIKNELSQEYNSIRKLMLEGHDGITPLRFISFMYKNIPSFQRFHQEDAHEFLLYMLDTIQCPLFMGKKISHVGDQKIEETFYSLDVPVCNTLHESLQAYTQPEKVDWFNGTETIQVIKKYEITSYPTLLCIMLKRFTNQNKKMDTFVQFPLELTLQDTYELVAVCNHAGNTLGGHYTASVWIDKWYEFNDEQIYPTNPITNHAYCLLFRKKTV
jgi:ubiquitin carboxyl-terminal hydrolase 36/42